MYVWLKQEIHLWMFTVWIMILQLVVAISLANLQGWFTACLIAANFLSPVVLLCLSNVAMFPDLSDHLGENHVIITDRNDDVNKENVQHGSACCRITSSKGSVAECY